MLMKKRLFVWMFGICLLFAACAKKEAPAPSETNEPGNKTEQADEANQADGLGNKQDPKGSQGESSSEEEKDTPQASNKKEKQDSKDTSKEEGEKAAEDSQDSEKGAVPEVTFVDYSEDIKMESKDWILLSVQENCPVISIPGNEAAAEKMNLVFEQQHASNQTYIEEDKELAQSAYDDLSEEQKAEWTGYGYGATYKVMYCSANILSIACDSYEWQGTPHPNTWTTTYCFDVPTGKLLTLADVFTDKAKAGEIIDQHILDTITAEPYKDYLLEGYEDFVSDILREDVFYLNDKGLAVICNPYMVTAYAGGSIEIEVPYEDLKDVMDPQYVQGE